LTQDRFAVIDLLSNVTLDRIHLSGFWAAVEPRTITTRDPVREMMTVLTIQIPKS